MQGMKIRCRRLYFSPEFTLVTRKKLIVFFHIYSVQQAKETGVLMKQNTFVMSVLTLQFQFLERYLGILLL